jgi:hypothetical protein
MTTVMHRSFARAMGFNWPPGVACIVNGQPVTYADIRANKIEKQRRRLERIMGCEGTLRRAAHVWVFFVPGWIYGGWHLYIRTIKDQWWIRECDDLALSIMAMFPCGLLPMRENFHAWKIAFAQAYARAAKGRKQGMVACWIDVEPGRRPKSFLVIDNK